MATAEEDVKELVELIKLLGYIRIRATECIWDLILTPAERQRLYQEVAQTSEAFRIVMEEVKTKCQCRAK